MTYSAEAQVQKNKTDAQYEKYVLAARAAREAEIEEIIKNDNADEIEFTEFMDIEF
jgi:transposase-like protein